MKIDIVIPVYNEEAQVESSLAALNSFLDSSFSGDCRVIVADNGSTDQTARLATACAARSPRTRVARLEEKGRGRALRRVWETSDADIVSYMDVDLSTDLGCFPRLIEAISQEGHPIAVGSRLLPGARVRRGWRRETISRCYNRLVRAAFGARFSDAQCGFKALRADAARALLPLVEDNGWFFDTELLVLAERLGYRIFDMPVRWVDDPDSRVRLLETALSDLRGIRRLRATLRQRQASGNGVPAGGMAL